MFEIERNISDSNWHIERNFMIKRRKKPRNLLKLDVSFLVLSITCLVGTFLFYIMRLMEEHEEKVSQMFNQKRVFDKGWDSNALFQGFSDNSERDFLISVEKIAQKVAAYFFRPPFEVVCTSSLVHESCLTVHFNRLREVLLNAPKIM